MNGPRLNSAILTAAIVIGTCGFAAAQVVPIRADSAMVAAAHPLATAAGVEVLRDGGNAVDAAIATAFALAVVEPYSSGLGGGGFALTFSAASGQVRALDFRETAPAGATGDMFVRSGFPDTSLSRDGPLAVAVPGFVRGLWELHQQSGRLPWSRLLQPAICLARDGYPVSARLQERIELQAERFNAAARAVFLPGGRIPRIGGTLRQPDLAATLAVISSDGPVPFYEGVIAETLAITVQAAGGILTLGDLRAYRPRWRQPVTGRYRGHRICSMPPPSSGGVHLIEMLNILSGFEIADFAYGSAASCHLLAEAMKFAFADRSRWLGDPDFVSVPVSRLISYRYADSLRAHIRFDAARKSRLADGIPALPPESAETSHLSVIDKEGNAVAATLTINLSFGSGLVAGTTGVILNDEMDDFVIAPGVPNAFGLIGGKANAVEAGKRPLSSMTPTIVLKDDRLLLLLGSPGGSRIINSVLQVIVNVIDFDMNLQQAVAAPRIHHQWYPDRIYHEPYGISPDTAVRLRQLGHQLQEQPAIGNVQAVMVDEQTGQVLGASDPRGMGEAFGY